MKLTKTKLQQLIKEELITFIENKASTLDEAPFGKEHFAKQKAKQRAHADAVKQDIAKSKADSAYEKKRVAGRTAKRRALDDKIKATRPKKRPKPDPARMRPVHSYGPSDRQAKATKVPGTGPRYSKWIEKLQRSLTNAGFRPRGRNPHDGYEGPNTRKAIRKFQEKVGLTPSGRANRATMRALRKSDQTAQPGQFRFDAPQAEPPKMHRGRLSPVGRHQSEDVVGKGWWHGGKFYPSKKK